MARLAAIARRYDNNAATLVDERTLAAIGFSDHAIQRFCERSGLGFHGRTFVEPVIRDLLLQEGRVVRERPTWARSRNTAELYLQIGEWMLLVCRPSMRSPGRYDVVTVVNGPVGNTWEVALARGFVLTPQPISLEQPRRKRVSWFGSIGAGLRQRPAGGGKRHGVLAAIRAAHRDRKRHRDAEYKTAVEHARAVAWKHQQSRERAREAHLRRYGFIQ